MLSLIITVVFGLVIAYFATQNTQPVSISFMQYRLTGIPMYVIVLVALILGTFVSWLISMVGSISSFLTIHGKNKKISESKQAATDLTKRVHQLELENERLKTELDRSGDEKSL